MVRLYSSTTVVVGVELRLSEHGLCVRRLLPFSVGMEMMRESGGSLMMDTYTGANRAKSSYLPPASSASTSSSTAAGGSHYAAGEGLRRRAQREWALIIDN